MTPGNLLQLEFIVEEALIQVIKKDLEIEMPAPRPGKAFPAAASTHSIDSFYDLIPADVFAIESPGGAGRFEPKEFVKEELGNRREQRKGCLFENITDAHFQTLFPFSDRVPETGVGIEAYRDAGWRLT